MTPAPASPEVPAPRLLLFTRQGCCLCEGLEERLRDLGLTASGPHPALQLLDVDGDPSLQARYGLEVPVLALRERGTAARDALPVTSPGDAVAASALRELPRVPPRLAGAQLRAWLQKHGAL